MIWSMMLQSSNCSNEISPFKYSILIDGWFMLKFPGSALVAKQKLFSEKDDSWCNPNSNISLWSGFLSICKSLFIGIHLCKAEQPLRHGGTKKKRKKRETQKNKAYRKSIQKNPTVKRCLLIVGLKPLRL